MQQVDTACRFSEGDLLIKFLRK